MFVFFGAAASVLGGYFDLKRNAALRDQIGKSNPYLGSYVRGLSALPLCMVIWWAGSRVFDFSGVDLNWENGLWLLLGAALQFLAQYAVIRLANLEGFGPMVVRTSISISLAALLGAVLIGDGGRITIMVSSLATLLALFGADGGMIFGEARFSFLEIVKRLFLRATPGLALAGAGTSFRIATQSLVEVEGLASAAMGALTVSVLSMLIQVLFTSTAILAISRSPGALLAPVRPLDGFIRVGLHSTASVTLIFTAYALIPVSVVRLVATFTSLAASGREDRRRELSGLPPVRRFELYSILLIVILSGLLPILDVG